MRGEARLVAAGVLKTSAGRVAVSGSRGGSLAFAGGDREGGEFEAVWVERSGRETDIASHATGPVRLARFGVRLSSDGRTAFLRESWREGSELWVRDLVRVEREVQAASPLI